MKFPKKFFMRFRPLLLVAALCYLAFSLCRADRIVPIQDETVEHGVVGELANEVELCQNLSLMKPFERFGIRVATYDRELSQGTLTIALYQGDVILASATLEGEELQDNEWIWLDAPGSQSGQYQLQVVASGFLSGQAPTIYAADQASCFWNGAETDCGISYATLGAAFYDRDINGIIFSVFLLSLALLLQVRYLQKKLVRKVCAVLATLLLVCTSVLYLSSYLTTGRFVPDVLLNLCFAEKDRFQERVYEVSELQVELLNQYRADDTVMTQYYNIWTRDLNGEVLSLTFDFSEGAEKDQFFLQIFTRRGQEVLHHGAVSVINEGEPETALILPMWCEQLRIDYARTDTFLNLGEQQEQVAFQTITVNEEEALSQLRQEGQKNLCLALLLVLVGLTVVWLVKTKKFPEKIWRYQGTVLTDPGKQFLLFGGLFGLLFMMLLPIYQAPDENAHLRLIGAEVGYATLPDSLLPIVPLVNPKLDTHAGQHVDLAQYLSATQLSFDEPVERTGSPTIQLIRHLPQSIFLVLALWLGAGPFWVFMAGRFGAFLLYLVAGYTAIRLMPYRKQLMMALLLIPQLVQQSTTLSYDATLIAACMLFIAYIFHLREQEAQCGWKALLLLGAMLLVVALIKINYVLIAGAILLVPIEKWRFPVGRRTIVINREKILQRKVLLLLVCAIACVGAVFVLSHIQRGQIVLAFLTAPLSTIELLVQTFVANGKFYWESTFAVFGWLDTYPPNYFSFLIAGGLLLCTLAGEEKQEVQVQLGALQRGILLLLFLGGVISCFCGMILWSMTMYAIPECFSVSGFVQAITRLPRIEGVQGRYFLPVLPLFLLAIPACRRLRLSDVNVLQLCIQCTAILVTGWTLWGRYWS